MKFFDSLISDFYQLCNGLGFSSLDFDTDNTASCDNHLQIVMQRDTAFELEGTGLELVTNEPVDNSVVLIGDDLQTVKGNTRLARVCVVSVDDTIAEQSVHGVIKKIEYEKYKFYPTGYMMRASTGDKTEKVRVSKSALRDGLSFYAIGNLYIQKLLANPRVKGVRVYFITHQSFDYSALQALSRKNSDIVKTLDHVMSSVNFDCDSCNLKPICDEVEGLRELHFNDKM